MYCTEVKGKCIKKKCTSYKAIMNYMYCTKCKEEHKLGQRCKCGKEGNINFSRCEAECILFGIKV